MKILILIAATVYLVGRWVNREKFCRECDGLGETYLNSEDGWAICYTRKGNGENVFD